MRCVVNDCDLLHGLIERFSTFGATSDGGVCRLAASKEDGAARDYLCNWFAGHGFSVAIDVVGNVFGTLDLGERVKGGAVYCGSHIDSQPCGGRFDGIYGVVAGCAAALEIRKQVEHRRLMPLYRYLTVVAWTNEEGARFQPSLLGSSVFTGHTTAEDALALVDEDGVTLGSALEAIGYLGKNTPPAEPNWFVELHVEQGPELERARKQIGVVRHCWGARKFRVQFDGKPDHTGPTPMPERRDALRAASILIADVSARADASHGRLHGSVGRIQVEPNSPNVVPCAARLWVELRSGDEGALNAGETWLESCLESICAVTGCPGKIEETTRRGVVAFDPEGVRMATDAVNGANLEHMLMSTVAGHDAIAIQERWPTVLLFVPSVNGISHSPRELTKDEDLVAGLKALVAVLARLIAGKSEGRP